MDMTDAMSLPREYRLAIKRSAVLFGLAFLHLSTFDTEFTSPEFNNVPDRILQLMTVVSKETAQEKGPKPLYFTEEEVQDVLKCIGGLHPSLETEFDYIFSLQKKALQCSEWESVGNFCYTTTEENDEGNDKEKKKEKLVDLYTMDAFLLDASQMIVDLKTVSAKLHKDPWLMSVQTLLFELGQRQEGSIFQIDFLKLMALMELFGGSGMRTKTIQCDILAREIAEKLTTKGKFTKKRTRTVVLDARFRKRTPQMLLKPVRKPDTDEDSDEDSDEENSAGSEEESNEDRNEDRTNAQGDNASALERTHDGTPQDDGEVVDEVIVGSEDESGSKDGNDNENDSEEQNEENVIEGRGDSENASKRRILESNSRDDSSRRENVQDNTGNSEGVERGGESRGDTGERMNENHSNAPEEHHRSRRNSPDSSQNASRGRSDQSVGGRVQPLYLSVTLKSWSPSRWFSYHNSHDA